jgi:hypothetical protein
VSRVKKKALIATAPVILACAVFAPHRVTDSQSETAIQKTPVPVDVRPAAVTPESSEGEVPGNELPETVDLYGNEITDAVAKYQFDATGSLYELHSPQTEVPKLAPPKT